MTTAVFSDLLEAFSHGFSALPNKPEETPESVLKSLWLTAGGMPASAQRALGATLPALNEARSQQLIALIDEYQNGKPLSHITGRQQFCGIELISSTAALIPRKETEILAKAAVKAIKESATNSPLVIDSCTGCGNLPLYFASECEKAQIYASDLSEQAVELARKNAVFTGLADRVEFLVGDLLGPFNNGNFLNAVDVISCNPPYISSLKVPKMPGEISLHEPPLAFDGGAFGISILQRLITEAVNYLKPGGKLLFELGLGQGPSMIKRMARDGNYSAVEGIADEAGNIRVIVATALIR